MMRDEFRVRPAAEADLKEILRIERTAAEGPHWRSEEYSEILQPVEAWSEERVERCLLVAVTGGTEISGEQSTGERIVGFAVGALLGGTDEVEIWGELESVVVLLKERRRGVGKALCKAVVLWCEIKGAGTIDLEVRAGSTGAQTMYRELGFAEVGRRRGYYDAPVEDAVLMRWKLREPEMRGRGDGCGAG